MKRVFLCCVVCGLTLVLGTAVALSIQLLSFDRPQVAFDPYASAIRADTQNWAPAEPVREVQLVAEQFAPPTDPLAPDFDGRSRFDDPVQLASSDAPPTLAPPTFEAVSASASQAALVDQPIEATDLSEGMSYLIRVHRQQSRPTHRKVHMQRNYGGQHVHVIDFTSQVALPETLRIYAESVDLETQDGAFRLQCEGRVVVVAQQSMLRGTDLDYAEGEFTFASTEIVTPDATITAGESEFSFSIGALAVESIASPEDGAANQEATDQAATDQAATDQAATDRWPAAQGAPAIQGESALQGPARIEIEPVVPVDPPEQLIIEEPRFDSF